MSSIEYFNLRKTLEIWSARDQGLTVGKLVYRELYFGESHWIINIFYSYVEAAIITTGLFKITENPFLYGN